MLELAVITFLAVTQATLPTLPPGGDPPSPCAESIPPKLLGDAHGWARTAGNEAWQHYADEIRERQLLGCLFKTYLSYPTVGKGAVAQAEHAASTEIAALAWSLSAKYDVEVIIDGVADDIPFALGQYTSEDAYAVAAERQEQRAAQRAKILARRLRKMVPRGVDVETDLERLREGEGRRGVLVFLRYTRKAELEPHVAHGTDVSKDGASEVAPTRADAVPAQAQPRLGSAGDALPPVEGRWMLSPFVRAFYVFGHGGSYVWDKAGEVSGGLLLSRQMRRWSVELSTEFRYASIRTELNWGDSTDPLLVKHYLFPVMLGVVHRGLVAGLELAPGYLTERLHPEIPARVTNRRVSLSTGLYAGVRLPIPKSAGPWVELGYLFSWVLSPKFPEFEQGLGYVHSLAIRVGWGFSRKSRPR